MIQLYLWYHFYFQLYWLIYKTQILKKVLKVNFSLLETNQTKILEAEWKNKFKGPNTQFDVVEIVYT